MLVLNSWIFKPIEIIKISSGVTFTELGLQRYLNLHLILFALMENTHEEIDDTLESEIEEVGLNIDIDDTSDKNNSNDDLDKNNLDQNLDNFSVRPNK